MSAIIRFKFLLYFYTLIFYSKSSYFQNRNKITVANWYITEVRKSKNFCIYLTQLKISVHSLINLAKESHGEIWIHRSDFSIWNSKPKIWFLGLILLPISFMKLDQVDCSSLYTTYKKFQRRYVYSLEFLINQLQTGNKAIFLWVRQKSIKLF